MYRGETGREYIEGQLSRSVWAAAVLAAAASGCHWRPLAALLCITSSVAFDLEECCRAMMGETTSFPPLWRQKMTRSISVFVIALIFFSFFYSFPVFWPSKKKSPVLTLIHSSEQQMNLPSQSLTIYLRAARLDIRFLISVGRKSKENKEDDRQRDGYVFISSRWTGGKLRAMPLQLSFIIHTHT